MAGTVGQGAIRLEAATRALDHDELAATARALAERGDVRALTPERIERRTCIPLHRDAHLEAWLIVWNDDHDTGYHDHDRSSGAVCVVEGMLGEDRLRVGGDPRSSLYRDGETFTFGPDHIHRMYHAGGARAVSVHCYSPPLMAMGTYEIDADGVLSRTSVPPEHELVSG